MGISAERGIPAFFDDKRGQITTRQDEQGGADLSRVPRGTALKVPYWTTVHGGVADVLITGRLEYLLRPNQLGEGLLGDESSVLSTEDPGVPINPLTPRQEIYRQACIAVLQKNAK